MCEWDKSYHCLNNILTFSSSSLIPKYRFCLLSLCCLIAGRICNAPRAPQPQIHPHPLHRAQENWNPGFSKCSYTLVGIVWSCCHSQEWILEKEISLQEFWGAKAGTLLPDVPRHLGASGGHIHPWGLARLALGRDRNCLCSSKNYFESCCEMLIISPETLCFKNWDWLIPAST